VLAGGTVAAGRAITIRPIPATGTLAAVVAPLGGARAAVLAGGTVAAGRAITIRPNPATGTLAGDLVILFGALPVIVAGVGGAPAQLVTPYSLPAGFAFTSGFPPIINCVAFPVPTIITFAHILAASNVRLRKRSASCQ
jgi:hypothetical protein